MNRKQALLFCFKISIQPVIELFQQHGGSLVMIAKGNRSQVVTDACKKHGGFYLGSIGGPAALLAQENIKIILIINYEGLGFPHQK